MDSVEGETYNVRYWELVIPTKLSVNISERQVVGSDVQFDWNHKVESRITKVFKNLLED